MPTQPKIDAAEMAARFGWALSVLRSDKSLNALFNKAVAQGWEAPRFIAELRSTAWFKKHSEAYRNAIVLQKTDPATWKQRVDQTVAQINDLAGQMGAPLAASTAGQIARNALSFGWNDAQIKNVLAGAIKGRNNMFRGEAGANAEHLRGIAEANGVKLGDITAWVRNIASGTKTVHDYDEWIRSQAAGAFPAYADQIHAGMNMSDLAEPYRQQMAQTLELNPQDIDLFEPTMRKALQATDPATGKITAQPLWQFEQSLKKDQRWLKTNNAQDELMGAAHGVLQSFGVVS